MPKSQQESSVVGRNVAAVLLSLFGTGAALVVGVFIVGALEGVAPVPNQVGSAAGVALIVAGLFGTGRLVRRVAPAGSPLPSLAASSLLLILVGMRFSAAAEGVEREGIETPVLVVGGLVHGLLLAAGAGVRPRRPGRAAAAGLAALAVLAAVVEPTRPAAAWEAGVRLPEPTATQRRMNGVDLAASRVTGRYPGGSSAAEAGWVLGRRDDGVEGAVALEYAKSITPDLPYDQAILKVGDALKAQGFTPEAA